MSSPNGATTLQSATHALADSDAILRVAFANAPIGMLIATADLQMLRVNQALCQMLGYSEAELLTIDFWQLTYPDDLAPNQELVRRALAGEFSSYEFEKRYIHKDGHLIWGLLSGSLVRDEHGVPQYFLSQIQDISARKAAEAELVATHHNTRQLLERITDGFYALDRDWRVTYLNGAAERIVRHTREEMLGRSLCELSPPTVHQELFPAFQHAISGGTPVNVELYYAPFETWYEVRAYPSADGLSVFFRDVTERRRLTEELRASETKFRTLVEQLPAAVYLLAADESLTPIYVSPYLEVLTGYPADEVLDASRWLAILHPDDRDRGAAADARGVAMGEAFRLEYRFVRRDGSVVWVRDECEPMRDEAGRVIGWLGVMMDITDRVAAEEIQARLAAVVESAEDAIISSTIEGTMTSWNAGAQRLFGYDADEALGSSYAIVLPDDLHDLTWERRRAAVAGASVPPFETTRRRHDGSTFPASIALSPIRDRTGAVVGISSITRDITERKALEEELRAALDAAEASNRAKSQFLAMMSHELRTPLQAVLGYAEYLLADPAAALTADQRADLGYIQQGGLRMLTLINQLLDLSRIEAGRLELHPRAVDLGIVVEHVRQDVAPQALQKGLTLRLDLPEAMPLVRGDQERLRQVLLNLVGNAVKFTEAGAVTLSLTRTGDEMALAVRDSGCGIAPEALPHIFEAFRQGDDRLARRHGGAGLGLAIALKLAELMDGRITVESTLGAGSTFTLWVPIASSSPRAVAAR